MPLLQHCVPQKTLLLLLLTAAFFADAQNVGVGTTTPLAKLHVFQGSSGNASPFSPLVVEGNINTYINILSADANETGVLFGKTFDAASGGIVYNNNNTLNGFQFRTGGNQTRMVLDQNGNVGIGNSNPGFPLSFSAATGDKLSLWSNSSNSYGFGIQSSLLQIHTDIAVADIAFGYGSSSSFTETMRVKGNGNVGIGNSNPGFLLDVNNRIRIRSGGNLANTAGIWLNKTDNSAPQSFIGIEDDNYVGFYGAAGWKFSMNTQTGALKINGSEGQQRQVLSSNGNSAAGFTTLGNILGTYMKTAPTTGIPAPDGLQDYPLPALTHTITTTQKSRFIISANVSYHMGFCLTCTEAAGWLILKVNGGQVTTQNYGLTVDDAVSIANFMIDLNPGTHTIEFVSHYAGGSPHTIYPRYSSVIVLPVD
jgi:hypothetical protein